MGLEGKFQLIIFIQYHPCGERPFCAGEVEGQLRFTPSEEKRHITNRQAMPVEHTRKEERAALLCA